MLELMKQQPLHLVPSPYLPYSDLASPILAPALLGDFFLVNDSELMSLFGTRVSAVEMGKILPTLQPGSRGLPAASGKGPQEKPNCYSFGAGIFEDKKPTILPLEKRN